MHQQQASGHGRAPICFRHTRSAARSRWCATLQPLLQLQRRQPAPATGVKTAQLGSLQRQGFAQRVHVVIDTVEESSSTAVQMTAGILQARLADRLASQESDGCSWPANHHECIYIRNRWLGNNPPAASVSSGQSSTERAPPQARSRQHPEPAAGRWKPARYAVQLRACVITASAPALKPGGR